uniref:Uncharacterized protein n=1 Tax=Glossina pallidipes TaxID=7398 RepID=A0A1A9ZD31_GLOPL
MGVLRWRDLPGSRVSVGNHHNNNTANNQNNNHNSRGEVSRHVCREITVRLDEIKTAKLTRGANVPDEVLYSPNMKTASVGLRIKYSFQTVLRFSFPLSLFCLQRSKYLSVTVIGMLQKIVKYLVNLGCGYGESGIASPAVGRFIRALVEAKRKRNLTRLVTLPELEDMTNIPRFNFTSRTS